MVTFQAGRTALVLALVSLAAACSSEQQDWQAAESADTTEAWGHFLEQHPDSELAGQARARVQQLTEQRDWQHAQTLDSAAGYREYLSQHPSGKWSEEARIRIEASALGSAPRIAPPTPEEAAASRVAGVRALRLASAADESRAAQAAASLDASSALAQPGEAAEPATPMLAAGNGSATAAAAAGTAQPVTAGYGVQLGAFGSQASADREWQRLQERFGSELSGLSPRIVVASAGARTLYRLQAPAAGQAAARALCDSLKEQAQACVPVLTR